MTKVSLHRFVNVPRQFSKVVGWGLSLWTVGAIAPLLALAQENIPNIQPVRIHFTSLALALETTEEFWQTVAENTPDLITIMLYTPPASCEGYVGEAKIVAKDDAVSQTVHYLLTDEIPDLINFDLAGYRVLSNSDDDSVTIDFRRRPDTQRQFVSLATCEQRILFGSLQQTLLENSELGIESVEFTEQREPIRL
ncbi:hypothetical protein PN498_13705 [Oscillatoria sp. CS-180]|uniref:hypothetical protein n=1 Tax=Oscillatoria sp. CS-180 TaxID=3021720 RepID=UPI00232D7F6A|nr:hypothetical protein [Oscillatoria sp. CS-180]MDB9527051.1 hypothetical protein [Oscillatoria sp. CS-180]